MRIEASQLGNVCLEAGVQLLLALQLANTSDQGPF